MANYSAEIFNYCERGQNPGFWAEPLNAVSNGAFIVAGLAALVLWYRAADTRRDLAELALIFIVLVIGVGSFLFHTFATRWAAVADTAPIGVFMLAYLGYALARLARQPVWIALLGVLGLVAALAAAGTIRCGPGPCLNGSVGYLPAFAALAIVGAGLAVRGHPAGRYLLAAGLVFLVSLAFRTIDRAACPWTVFAASRPLGTHFIWHMLNAVVLYMLLRAAILHGRPADTVRGPAVV